MTGGLTEVARIGTRNCRACGHKMSLHTPQSNGAPVVVVQDGPAASPESSVDPLAIPPTVSTPMLELRLKEATHKAESLEAKAATAEAKGKQRAAETARQLALEKRMDAQRFADEIERRSQPAEALREPEHAAPPVTAPATAADLADQLARLADLKASGVLNDEEFAAAKARLLG